MESTSPTPMLLVLQEDEVIHTLPALSPEPVLIGRAPGCTLVLTSNTISWHHAMLWTEGGRLWIKDIGSTNGTFVDDNRILKPTQVPATSTIRLGTDILIKSQSRPEADNLHFLFLEELSDSGVVQRVESNLLHFGRNDQAHVKLSEGPELAATIQVHRDGEFWLILGEEERALEIGEAFEVEGRRFQLRVDRRQEPTAQIITERFPYSLSVNLQGATGPIAELRNNNTGQSFTIQSNNRVVLLYILARRLADEMTEPGKLTDDVGWCKDEEVSSGIWGRGWQEHSAGHLHVLVHRLRNQIKQSGFDPWFIEKKRRHVRVRLKNVEVL